MSKHFILFDMSSEIERLREWFLSEKRSLPWRDDPSPYRVWVSEVMLQQTQVTVVIPYFEKWMERFPTVKDLADAELDEVIKLWEGLGYYSRARNLLDGAKMIMKDFNGKLPDTEKELKKIKGIGPYTVGAILSFAFHQKAPAVDGNVIRVLARYFLIEEEIQKPKVIQEIRALANTLLPDQEPWVIAEALIELGAKICHKKPLCQTCPLQKSCLAYRHGKAKMLPNRAKREKTIYLNRAVAIISHQDKILVKRGEKKGLMQDLYEFPYFETDKSLFQKSILTELISKYLGIQGEVQKELEPTSHSFTKYRALLHPFAFICKEESTPDGFLWVPKSKLHTFPFSSGHKRILKQLVD